MAQIAGEERVPGVEADADVGRRQRPEQPEQVSHVPGEQMRQHVLEHQADAELAGAPGDAIERFDRAVHAIEALSPRHSGGLRTGMEHEESRFENRRSLRGLADLAHCGVAGARVERRNVDLVGERRMERMHSEPELADPRSGGGAGGAIVKVEVRRRGGDLDLSEAGVADRLQATEQRGAPEGAGRQSQRQLECRRSLSHGRRRSARRCAVPRDSTDSRCPGRGVSPASRCS